MIRTTTAMNWIIMPYVNDYPRTAQALDDCLAQTLPDVRILLIDNSGKLDGWGRFMTQGDDRFWLWRHDPPLPALAATWNAALQFVWEAGEDHVLVVNNDVRLPPDLYTSLLQVQRRTGAWFVSATNVGDAYDHAAPISMYDLFDAHSDEPTRAGQLLSKGGPDFSCFLITKDCHRWFQFDEGFRPAYHEDNDYHRRLQLAGLGDKIFSVCVPYLHYGSGTLKADPKLQETWGPKFAACQAYYQEKWGGLPGSETLNRPFVNAGEGIDGRPYLLGQGKEGKHPRPEGGYPWESDSTS